MKCPYDGFVMELLGGVDETEPAYWCPMCEKSFDEDSPELSREED